MNDLDARLTPVQRFGRELARCRREKGLSQARLAERLGCSPSLIGHIETGTRRPQLDFAEGCDRVFEPPDAHRFARLCRRISESPSGPEWFLRWQEEIEPQATTLRTWDPLLVPGLLQTEAYARAVFRGHLATTEQEVEEQVRSRMRRSLILDKDEPPALWVLLDEWVLQRFIGGPQIMCEQLTHLASVATRRNVTLQLAPYDSPSTDGLMSGFAIAELANAPTTVSIESAGTGEVSAEHELVSVILGRYDTIRAEAYRPGESIEKIKEAVAQWTQRV
ncbi:helix-turn-helix domain-containing protein [Sphaerisporangium corydalis]|uniref:Scr1 family TA system antitoxin-like transcriptional regulator n=1 Tax=Sphaerisporangium corydalis TaxID=1441875 RepID=A0ABV9EC89_9ACTN|nr:helix-turn-helix transcriptional regulator [Sphaerisporangium corydalis]